MNIMNFDSFKRFNNVYNFHSYSFAPLNTNTLSKNDNLIFSNSFIKNEISNDDWIIYDKLSSQKIRNYKQKYTLLKDIKKENELINLIKEKAPHVFQEGKLDIEILKEELGLLDENYESNEKYGLYWKGKFESLHKAKQSSLMTLIPQKDKSLNFDESNNIIIEGDNLEVLKLLQSSYFNKVDVIYIDPPYNTGNDFVYNDNYKEGSLEYKIQNGLIDDEGNKTTTNQKSDGRFHTNWLNMMYPRLILARKLLKDDGVIFISIDDNEQARLKMICDDIFGEQNFISDLVWLRNPGGESDNAHIAKTKDFILFYAKNKDFFEINDLKKEIDILDFKKDEKGNLYRKGSMLEKSGENDRLIDRPNLGYTIWYNPNENKINVQNDNYDRSKINESLTIKTKIYEFHDLDKDGKDESGYFPIIPRIIKNTYGCWRKGQNTFLNEFYQGKYIFEKDKKNNWRIYEREIIELKNPYKHVKPKDFISFTTNSNGTNEFKKIFNGISYFTKPKPFNLISYLINFHKSKNALILDFFAGSGTTGQAVMELNKEDGGNRKYILVQLPEKVENSNEFATICDITRERIKRSIQMYGYKEKGFKSFKLVESNLKINNMSNQNSINEIQMSLNDLVNKIKDDRNVEDLIYEIILRSGLELDIELKNEVIDDNNIYYNNEQTHLFILEPTINQKYYQNIIKAIKAIYKEQSEFNVYLNDQYFENDEDKINFIEQVKLLNQEIKVWVI